MKHAFITGAQKAGTTFLHHALAGHPDFCARADKEPHYFSSNLFDGVRFQDIFPDQPGSSVLLDSSASYLHTPGAAQRIRDAGLDPLILIQIRNPWPRAISGFLHNAKNGRDTRSAQDALFLGSTKPEDIFVEETERIEKARRKGQIILRPSYATHFGDRAYSHPLWTFRYVSNSLYAWQARDFRDRFETVRFVDFDLLIRDPLHVVNLVRNDLDLAAVDTLPKEIGQNKTRIGKAKVIRKFLRNHEYSVEKELGMLQVGRACATVLWRDYDAKSISASLPKPAWVAPAQREYETLKTSSLSAS